METGPYFGRPRNSKAKGILAALPLSLVHFAKIRPGIAAQQEGGLGKEALCCICHWAVKTKFMPVLGVLNSTECGGLHDKAAVDVH